MSVPAQNGEDGGYDGPMRRAVTIVALLACAATALAVPPTLLVQGRLVNAGGPVDGDFTLVVVLYAEPEAVTEVHKETFAGQQISGGVFSVTLGTEAPIAPALFEDHSALWLQLEVDGAPLGAPAPLASVAWAFHASTATTAAVARALPTAPSDPVPCAQESAGRFYLNTTDAHVYVCNGQESVSSVVAGSWTVFTVQRVTRTTGSWSASEAPLAAQTRVSVAAGVGGVSWTASSVGG